MLFLFTLHQTVYICSSRFNQKSLTINLTVKQFKKAKNMALQEEFEEQGTWLFRYRGSLPLILLLMGWITYIRTEVHPETVFIRNTPYENYFELFCILVSLAGLAVRIYTVGCTPKNTSGRNVTGQLAETLNTTGIYSVVRHPLYVGNFFMWLGPALVTEHLWFIISFCLFYWIYYERIMYAEEQFLRRKFRTTYTEWAKNVPAFIPLFKNFKRSELPFSWKKVLKKEKNGLAAVFLIFAAFDVSGELIKGERNFNYFLIAICILTVLLYIVLKYLKKKTNILNEAGR